MTLKFQPLNFPNHDTLGCPSFAVHSDNFKKNQAIVYLGHFSKFQIPNIVARF